MKPPLLTFMVLIARSASLFAQTQTPAYRGQGFVDLGFGTGFRTGYHPLIIEPAFGGEGFVYRGFAMGAEVAFPYMSYGFRTVIGSIDGSYHFDRHAKRGSVDLFIFGGPSISGPTNSGAGRGTVGGNIGAGANWWVREHTALRFKVRDHFLSNGYLPGNEVFSSLSFRVGVTFR